MKAKTTYGMTLPGRSKSRSRNMSVSAAISLFAAGSLMAASPVRAAPTSVEAAGTVTVVAHHLDNPRGLAFGPNGELYIAEAGHGGGLCLAGGGGPEGPACVGLTSGITKLSHGRQTKVIDKLISVASPDGTGAGGLVAVSTENDRIYGQVSASSAGMPPGLPSRPVFDAARAQLGRTLAINGDGSWSVLASTGDTDYAWTNDHQDLEPHQFPDANPNGLATSGGTQYVADAGANLIAKVDNGNVSMRVYLPVPGGSTTDAVPTCVAKAPDGSLYVGELLGGEYEPGHARVWRIADGTATVKWTGFTGIQGCGFDDVGNFYATEFQASGMFGPDPSGDVIKVTPQGVRTSLVEPGSLFLPSGFAYRDGAVYVSNWSMMPAANRNGHTGEVVRISLG